MYQVFPLFPCYFNQERRKTVSGHHVQWKTLPPSPFWVTITANGNKRETSDIAKNSKIVVKIVMMILRYCLKSQRHHWIVISCINSCFLWMLLFFFLQRLSMLHQISVNAPNIAKVCSSSGALHTDRKSEKLKFLNLFLWLRIKD